jgi:hypothetical protein
LKIFFWLALILISCGKIIKNSWNGISKDFSAFDVYSTENCEIYQRGELIQKTLCSDLGPEQYKREEICHRFLTKGEEGPQVKFPDHNRKANYCQSFNKSLTALDLSGSTLIRIIVLSDFGRGENASLGYRQKSVARAIDEVCQSRSGCNFAIAPGDLFYPDGVYDVWDGKLRNLFDDIYNPKLPFYLVAGNHDHEGNLQALLEYSMFNPNFRMPELFYKIPGLPDFITIVGVDTQLLADEATFAGESNSLLNSNQQELLRSSLCENKGWRVIFGHYPTLSRDGHPTVQGSADFLNRFYDKCPYDLYISGHNHFQEYIKEDSRHYLIQGAGGADLHGEKEEIVESEGYFRAKRHGFALLEVSKSKIKVEYFDVSSWINSNYKGLPKAFFSTEIEK